MVPPTPPATTACRVKIARRAPRDEAAEADSPVALAPVEPPSSSRHRAAPPTAAVNFAR